MSGFADISVIIAAYQAAGTITTIRWSRGLDTDAACGQLRLHPE